MWQEMHTSHCTTTTMTMTATAATVSGHLLLGRSFLLARLTIVHCGPTDSIGSQLARRNVSAQIGAAHFCCCSHYLLLLLLLTAFIGSSAAKWLLLPLLVVLF